MNAGIIIRLVAIIPMATGPLPMPQEQRTLTMGLCDGGQIVIPLGNEDEKPERDCHQQACHAGTCREKAKPTGKLTYK